MVLFGQNFEPQIVTSNTLISLYEKLRNILGKIYENLFGMAQNFYSTQHMLFFFIFLLTVKFQILLTTLYIDVCQHDERLKLLYDENFRFFLLRVLHAAYAMHKHVAC